ncbi:MAG: HAMP domain-containing sensor histidine kinase [Acidimicrobiales bacterium]
MSTRGGPRWAHAAKVATGATVVVAAVAVVVALVVNLMIVDHLGSEVDGRLSDRLADASHQIFRPSASDTPPAGKGDLDDAPVFVWRILPSGVAIPEETGSPALPSRHWSAGTVTLSMADSTFRLRAEPNQGGWLVAGESVARLDQVRNELLVAEALLGALLLLVTFAGSFVVGLRASAPIEEIRRRQAEFTADASHELRTPLSVIEAEVDLALSRGRDPTSYQATLRRISSESGRLRSIVEDLLWLARADDLDRPDGQTTRTVDVAAVGEACADRFEAVARTMSVSLIPRLEGQYALIRADGDAVDRLISVLLDNACRYAGNGGRVELRVTNTGGQVTLSVEDSGPGIPESERDLVLDRFHRADERPGGTGLGLAIADVVVRTTGGSWSIGSSALGGARMAVTWRAVSAHPSALVREPVPT